MFGRRSRTDNDFELFVFITPHVIYSDQDLQDAAGEVRRGRPRIQRATEGMQPFVQPRRDPDAPTEPANPSDPPDPRP